MRGLYEKLGVAICSVLPMQYDVVMRMDYPQFFRTVNIAHEEIERQKNSAREMKNRKKGR